MGGREKVGMPPMISLEAAQLAKICATKLALRWILQTKLLVQESSVLIV